MNVKILLGLIKEIHDTQNKLDGIVSILLAEPIVIQNLDSFVKKEKAKTLEGKQ